jgi:hypothetical protein
MMKRVFWELLLHIMLMGLFNPNPMKKNLVTDFGYPRAPSTNFFQNVI